MADVVRADASAAQGARTERGRRTRQALLDAAVHEFGERGFHATGIGEITRRAGVALGSFYTHFESKEAVFRAAIAYLSEGLKAFVAPRLAETTGAAAREGAALSAFLDYVDANQAIYRIIDEAEFVAPDAHRAHYETTVSRIARRLKAGAETGELRDGIGEVEAWAVAGMNVFLGLRFGLWADGEDRSDVIERANRLLREGLERRGNEAA
ncbi:MAG: TetR/AcrR family transcriptional regulator [Sphingomonadaceae bacterium]|nr:TetR/AcrR family transcriptional regulator [Sphingomonadaceae bacterium]